jgi:hypothetical protein
MKPVATFSGIAIVMVAVLVWLVGATVIGIAVSFVLNLLFSTDTSNLIGFIVGLTLMTTLTVMATKGEQ